MISLSVGRLLISFKGSRCNDEVCRVSSLSRETLPAARETMQEFGEYNFDIPPQTAEDARTYVRQGISKSPLERGALGIR